MEGGGTTSVSGADAAGRGWWRRRVRATPAGRHPTAARRAAAARMHQALARVLDPATTRALGDIGFAPGPAEDDFDGDAYPRGWR
jgi:hypothetical protein